jgi:transcription elongation factor
MGEEDEAETGWAGGKEGGRIRGVNTGATRCSVVDTVWNGCTSEQGQSKRETVSNSGGVMGEEGGDECVRAHAHAQRRDRGKGGRA